MSAKKKAIIAIIVGAVIGAVIGIYMMTYVRQYGEMIGESQTGLTVQSFLMVPCCMLYAFGYAFGWKRCKGFLAGAAKVSADISFFYLIVHLITGKGIGKGLFIAMFVFSFAVGVVWVPGVVYGIKDLMHERQGACA